MNVTMNFVEFCGIIKIILSFKLSFERICNFT